MKKFVVLIAICALAIPSQGQDPQDYSENKNEINLGYFNAFVLNEINELGLGYKLMINNGALRTGIGFNFSIDETDYETEQYNYSGYNFSPRVGYEFHQYFNRLRLYYGADLVTSFINNKSEITSDTPNMGRTDISKGYEIGLNPILGLTVFINKTVSISTETYLDFSYYSSTEEQIRSTGSATNTSKGLSMGIGPLGIISVNFHF